MHTQTAHQAIVENITANPTCPVDVDEYTWTVIDPDSDSMIRVHEIYPFGITVYVCDFVVPEIDGGRIESRSLHDLARDLANTMSVLGI
jgi:hypothetical protein